MSQRPVDSILRRQRKFILLDGMRGIAAISVATLHLTTFFGYDGPFPHAYLAVDFFFVLSGFVITYAYEGRLHDGELSASAFMVARLIRLYPLYLLALVLLLPALRSADAETMAAFVANLFFLPSPVTAKLFPFNVPSWSLFFELLANFAYGCLLWRLTTRHLTGLVLVMGMILCWAGLSGTLNSGTSWATFHIGLIRVSFSFFAGVLIYRVRPQISVHLAIPIVLLCAILLAFPNATVAFEIASVILGFPVIVWLGSAATIDGATATVFSRLGAASYGVYVLQDPLHRLASNALRRLGLIDQVGTLSGIVFIAAMVLAVLVIDRYYDVPIRRFLGGLMRRDRDRKIGEIG